MRYWHWRLGWHIGRFRWHIGELTLSRQGCKVTGVSRQPPPGVSLGGPISDRMRGMTKKTKVVGYQTGGSGNDKYLSPRGPYTGDGKTRRTIFDSVKLVFQPGKGK